jgi:hypothetical protein
VDLRERESSPRQGTFLVYICSLLSSHLPERESNPARFCLVSLFSFRLGQQKKRQIKALRCKNKGLSPHSRCSLAPNLLLIHNFLLSLSLSAYQQPFHPTRLSLPLSFSPLFRRKYRLDIYFPINSQLVTYRKG